MWVALCTSCPLPMVLLRFRRASRCTGLARRVLSMLLSVVLVLLSPNRQMLLPRLSHLMISTCFPTQASPGRPKYILVVLCFRPRGMPPELLELFPMLFACLRSS